MGPNKFGNPNKSFGWRPTMFQQPGQKNHWISGQPRQKDQKVQLLKVCRFGCNNNVFLNRTRHPHRRWFTAVSQWLQPSVGDPRCHCWGMGSYTPHFLRTMFCMYILKPLVVYIYIVVDSSVHFVHRGLISFGPVSWGWVSADDAYDLVDCGLSWLYSFYLEKRSQSHCCWLVQPHFIQTLVCHWNLGSRLFFWKRPQSLWGTSVHKFVCDVCGKHNVKMKETYIDIQTYIYKHIYLHHVYGRYLYVCVCVVVMYLFIYYIWFSKCNFLHLENFCVLSILKAALFAWQTGESLCDAFAPGHNGWFFMLWRVLQST